MDTDKISTDIKLKPFSKDYYSVELKGLANEVEFLDLTSNVAKVVLFSADTSDGYITDEPIRNLFFKEGVKNLKIFISNITDVYITGHFDIKYVYHNNDKKIVLPSEYLSTNYSNKDIIEMGNKVFAEEQKNNYFFNKTSPVSVKYYRVEPDKKSTDFMLNEYGIKGVVAEACMNVLTPNNTLPQDEDAMYTEWGYQYSSFTVNISDLYFEDIFGKGKKPRKDDFMVFMNRGIFMVVSSVVALYGGNNCLIGYKLSLSHNHIDGSVQGTESLEMFANNSEKFFRNFAMKDGKDSTNEEFNLPHYIHHDFNRKIVTTDVKIVENPDKWNYYSPIKVDREVEHPVVSYNNKIITNKNFAVSFYHQFEKEILDDIIFKIGDVIEFGFASGIPYLSYYGAIISLESSGDIAEVGIWYIYALNINIEEEKLDFIRYEESVEVRESRKHDLPRSVLQETNDFNLFSYNSLVGRIRVWKNVLPIQFEKRILYSSVVEKSSSAFIIDNCDIILNSRTHARPDNMEEWKNFEKNRSKVN